MSDIFHSKYPQFGIKYLKMNDNNKIEVKSCANEKYLMKFLTKEKGEVLFNQILSTENTKYKSRVSKTKYNDINITENNDKTLKFKLNRNITPSSDKYKRSQRSQCSSKNNIRKVSNNIKSKLSSQKSTKSTKSSSISISVCSNKNIVTPNMNELSNIEKMRFNLNEENCYNWG